MARIAESLTALLISINVRHKRHAGLRITGLPSVSVVDSCRAAPAGRSWRAASTTWSASGLTVIANTGDDIEIHGAHVSPDPDLVAFWLAGLIDERGWGMRDDTFAVMDGLRELRRRRLVQPRRPRPRGLRSSAPGCSPTAHAEPTHWRDLTSRSAWPPAVLPMTEQPVRTGDRTGDALDGLQEFMIRERGEAPIAGRRFARRRAGQRVARGTGGARRRPRRS